ncbi:mannose-6-phosphate isomerase, class I, partial [Streptomyces sp. McG2]|nr:mannose-6-phosphate isomerase, class I [Streptomyces sp. McG2]
PELLRIVRFDPATPAVLRPEASPDGEEVYDTPVHDFRLSRYVLAPGAPVRDLTLPTPQILLGTEGSPTVGELLLGPGQSVFVPAGEPVELRGPGTVFRATALT